VSVPCAAVHKQLTCRLAKGGPLRKFVTLLQYVIHLVVVIIIIIIICQELGLNRPVSASSTSLFRGLPSRLHPFGL